MATIYGNRWKTISNIGGGGQSDVFRVTDTADQLEGEWALKRLRRKDRVARFRQEVGILRRMEHENIIKIVDAQVAEDGGDETSYLVMPIAEHGDLDDRLPIYTGNIDSVVQVAKEIANALHYAHRAQVIHRDIKPGNILFPEAGHKVWIADFGLSLDQTAERNTPDTEVVGPRFFIAPELDDAGSVAVTAAADVYSLGQMMFYMLSGGKRIAREAVFDERYTQYFARGQRYALLRLLLNKMIAPLSSRHSDMSIVLQELEQIEKWEEQAAAGLLDNRALAATGSLQKMVAEEAARNTSFETVRSGEIVLRQSVVQSVADWLQAQLEATGKIIATGGMIEVGIGIKARFGAQPIQVDTGNNTLLEQREILGLSVSIPTDRQRRNFEIHFLICGELRFNFGYDDPHYLGSPGNPMMAVLPMYAEQNGATSHMNSEAGYFFGKPIKYGVPDPIPMTSAPPFYPQMTHRGYNDGSMAIVRFNAQDWPAAQADVKRMMGEVMSRFMEHVAKQR